MTNHNKARHTSPAKSANPNHVQPAKTGHRALVVGLEILEFLAKCATPPTHATISTALNVPLSMVLRALAVLEERGYTSRIDEQGAYGQTDKVFELRFAVQAHQRLLNLAKPVMRSLSASIMRLFFLSSTIATFIILLTQSFVIPFYLY